MGNIIRVKVNRSNNSMGIALAGHRNRNEMGCFIAGLNPKGAASSKNLKIGDEILEVILAYSLFICIKMPTNQKQLT